MTKQTISMVLGALSIAGAVTLSGPTLAQAQRQYLTKADLETTLVGKAHTFKHVSSGSLVKWDIREGGRIYYNNFSRSNTGGNGSGTWELKDDGSLCIRWARTFDGGANCVYFFKEGEILQRTSELDAAAPVNAIVTAIE